MRKRELSRLLALAMSFAMLLALAAPASAESDALSAELVLESEGLEISGKVACSPTEQVLLAAAQLLLGGENYGDISLTASEQALTVESKFLDKIYGVALPTLAENLEKSIFAPNSGSAYALDEETYNEILAYLSGEMLAETMTASQTLGFNAEELTAAMEPLVALFTQLVEQAQEYLIYQTRKTDVTINGTDYAVTQVSVTADVESLTNVCNALMDGFESDTAVQSSVATLIDLFGELDEGTTGADYVNVILESMPEIREEIAETLADSEFALTVSACVIDDEASTPVKFGLDVSADGDTVSLAFLMSPEMDYFRLEASAGYTDYALELTVRYEDAYIFQLDVLEDEEVEMRYQLSFDDSAFVFAITENYEYYDSETDSWYSEPYGTTLAGTYAVSDNLFTLTISEIDGEDLGGTITLNLRNNDSITVPTFTELTGLSEDDFTEVVQALMTGVQTLDQLLAG